MTQSEQEAFERVWQRAAAAFTEGLADPNYPDDRREWLYDALAGANECLALCAATSSLSYALLTAALMLPPQI